MNEDSRFKLMNIRLSKEAIFSEMDNFASDDGEIDYYNDKIIEWDNEVRNIKENSNFTLVNDTRYCDAILGNVNISKLKQLDLTNVNEVKEFLEGEQVYAHPSQKGFCENQVGKGYSFVYIKELVWFYWNIIDIETDNKHRYLLNYNKILTCFRKVCKEMFNQELWDSLKPDMISLYELNDVLNGEILQDKGNKIIMVEHNFANLDKVKELSHDNFMLGGGVCSLRRQDDFYPFFFKNSVSCTLWDDWKYNKFNRLTDLLNGECKCKIKSKTYQIKPSDFGSVIIFYEKHDHDTVFEQISPEILNKMSIIKTNARVNWD